MCVCVSPTKHRGAGCTYTYKHAPWRMRSYCTGRREATSHVQEESWSHSGASGTSPFGLNSIFQLRFMKNTRGSSEGLETKLEPETSRHLLNDRIGFVGFGFTWFLKWNFTSHHANHSRCNPNTRARAAQRTNALHLDCVFVGRDEGKPK